MEAEELGWKLMNDRLEILKYFMIKDKENNLTVSKLQMAVPKEVG